METIFSRFHQLEDTPLGICCRPNPNIIRDYFLFMLTLFPGRGYYGEVALARNLQPGSFESLVVVKSLLMPSLCHEQEFNKDIKLFNEVDHPNVTRLLGFCYGIKPPIAIFEYCDRVRREH